MSKETNRAFYTALSTVKKTFGPGIAMQIGKEKIQPAKGTFSTGSIAIDRLTNGGFPREMITEVFGPEGGGKSSLAMTAVGLAQNRGEKAVYIDVEHAFNPNYATKLGVDVHDLVISQPDYAEQALQIAETFIDSGGAGIIVIDSVAMLTPKCEVEGEIGDSNVAPLPRIMGQALRKLTVKVRKNNVALIFINQVRDIINGFGYGEKTLTPGGRALRHTASLRLDIRRIGALKKGERIIGARVRAKVLKSRVCDPFQEAEFDLLYGLGISREGDLIDVATEMGLIAKEKGSYYKFGDYDLGHGREEARLHLVESPELFAEIRGLVLEKTS